HCEAMRGEGNPGGEIEPGLTTWVPFPLPAITWLGSPGMTSASHPARLVDLVQRVGEAGERIGVPGHRAALGGSGDDERLARLHQVDEADLVGALPDPGGAVAAVVLGEELELVAADLGGGGAAVLVLVARVHLRLRLGLAAGPVGDQEIDRIALDLARIALARLGHGVAGLVRARAAGER